MNPTETPLAALLLTMKPECWQAMTGIVVGAMTFVAIMVLMVLWRWRMSCYEIDRQNLAIAERHDGLIGMTAAQNIRRSELDNRERGLDYREKDLAERELEVRSKAMFLEAKGKALEEGRTLDIREETPRSEEQGVQAAKGDE